MVKAIGYIASTLLLSTGAWAQQAAFRVDTKVLIEPAKRTLTLFSEGVCYDFALDDSAAVTLIDPARNRILLLDPIRQIKTTLDMQELLDLVAKARQAAVQSDLGSLFAAEPKGHFDESSQVVTVGDEQLVYRASLQKPSEKSMADQYATFADWSARLNAVFSPHFPPYLRLELNRMIADQGKLPLEIARTTQHQGKASTIRCQLTANWRISKEDEQEVRRVGTMLAQFNEVTQAEYFAQQQRLVSKNSK